VRNNEFTPRYLRHVQSAAKAGVVLLPRICGKASLLKGAAHRCKAGFKLEEALAGSFLAAMHLFMFARFWLMVNRHFDWLM
jgi:hypothetical protein